MNLYSYVHNDPINMIDPTGMCSEENSGSEILCKIEDTITETIEPIIEWIMEAVGQEVVPEDERDPEGKFDHEAEPNDLEEELTAIAAAIIVGNSNGNDEYTGHGDNPEGKTGKGSNWQKHSGKRAGKRYGAGRNKNKGRKNKKYIKPANPNKKK